jgi:hypothetical protein
MSNASIIEALKKGSATDQAVSALAQAIGQSKQTSKQRQLEKAAADKAAMYGQLAHARELADTARTQLLADLEAELNNGTEPHLVRCHVALPVFQTNGLATERKALETEFRDHLSAPLMGMVHFTKIADPTSPWYGHLVATISVHA